MAYSTQDRDKFVEPEKLKAYLEGIDFPAEKKELIEIARNHGAGETVLYTLERTPDLRYHSLDEVIKTVRHMKN